MPDLTQKIPPKDHIPHLPLPVRSFALSGEQAGKTEGWPVFLTRARPGGLGDSAPVVQQIRRDTAYFTGFVCEMSADRIPLPQGIPLRNPSSSFRPEPRPGGPGGGGGIPAPYRRTGTRSLATRFLHSAPLAGRSGRNDGMGDRKRAHGLASCAGESLEEGRMRCFAGWIGRGKAPAGRFGRSSGVGRDPYRRRKPRRQGKK